MILNKKNISQIRSGQVEIPASACFDLPERVLQFGTGVLLRGLTDYFIDKANKKGIFRGRIVIVKSTGTGDTDSFAAQDNLYTQCIRGIQAGKKSEEYIINASVSRILSAKNDWEKILQYAASPDLAVVISNTTEVGIALGDDRIDDQPPASFPGKLLTVLYKRFKQYKGDPSKGLVIIPTELIPDNGRLLLSILLELSVRNKLEEGFSQWLTNCNDFCNSLVDRIVPGKLPADQQQEIQQKLGYQDDCMIMSETYRLWAIESSSGRVREVLSFQAVDEGVVIAPDIHIFRELKLRLLNGSHTFCCGLAWLAGFTVVREAMEDAAFSRFISRLMEREIIPSIIGPDLSPELAREFAAKVLDRYRNPYLDHPWLSITLQYTSKMKMRNVPLILEFHNRLGEVPRHMALGFAAHLLFMRCEAVSEGKYQGRSAARSYPVNDERAAYYAEVWSGSEPGKLPRVVLGNTGLWGTDLTQVPGFADKVTEELQLLISEGADAAMKLVDEAFTT